MGKEKRQNLNFARNMDIDAWRQRQISKRVMLRLAESDKAFKAEHADDTDGAPGTRPKKGAAFGPHASSPGAPRRAISGLAPGRLARTLHGSGLQPAPCGTGFERLSPHVAGGIGAIR